MRHWRRDSWRLQPELEWRREQQAEVFPPQFGSLWPTFRLCHATRILEVERFILPQVTHSLSYSEIEQGLSIVLTKAGMSTKMSS